MVKFGIQIASWSKAASNSDFGKIIVTEIFHSVISEVQLKYRSSPFSPIKLPPKIREET